MEEIKTPEKIVEEFTKCFTGGGGKCFDYITPKDCLKALRQALNIQCASGGLSDTEVKWLVLYGQKNRESESDNYGRIDYAFHSMFDFLKTSTVFNSEEIERVFWSRMKLLLNSR